MFNSQEQKILHLLVKAEYMTATELSEKLGIGVKTVRTRIKELNSQLTQYDVAISSKPRYGYYLNKEEKEQIEVLLKNGIHDEGQIPATSRERIHYLLAYLLNQKDYVKSENLCEFLYISKGTLTNSLRQVEEVYQKYHITIDKKPNYGIKVKGREFDIRQCMMDVFVKKDGLEGVGRIYQTQEIQSLGKHVYQCMPKYGIEFSEIAYNDFIEHIYIAIRRIRQGQFVEEMQGLKTGQAETEFIKELAEFIEGEYHVTFPKVEQEYLLLQLAGKGIVKEGQRQDNFVMQSEMDELVNQMLNMVYREFQIDFRNNLGLRMELNQHLVPLSIRLKYHIFFRNPMLEEIKKNYIFAYTVAFQVSSILKEYYECDISEDEIGELAEIFELALEQRESDKKKYSILIVCASGRSSSQLLKYRYSQEFKENIKEIYVCNLYEVEAFDFSKVDYVFTTVPIQTYVPVPILEVSSFLKESDITAVRKLFEQESKEFLRKYYRPELFFTDIHGTTRDEVLAKLCGRVEMATRKNTVWGNIVSAADLFASVLSREELSPTDYGNLVAIPHPDKVFLETTLVAVAILEKPIIWNREQVQIIILTLIGSEEDPDIQKFYEATTDLLLRTEDISELIYRRTFDSLIGMLKK